MKFKSSLFLSLALASTAFAQVLDLPVIGAGNSINDSGQITGSVNLPGGNSQHQAMLWQNGSGREISDFPGTTGQGVTINTTGNIVGISTPDFAGNYHAYAWITTNGGVTYTQKELSSNGVAYGINSSSWAVGTNNGSAAVWRTSDNGANYSIQDLGALSGGDDSFARRISDSFQIVGQEVLGGCYQAGIWHTSNSGASYDSFIKLSPGGYLNSIAHDINSSNSVVGLALNSWGAQTAVVWTHTGAGNTTGDYTYNDLGAQATALKGATASEARAINAAGETVGFSTIGGTDHASLWHIVTGTYQDLNDVIGASQLAAAGFSMLNQACDVNDNGDIVGRGTGLDGSTYGFLIKDGQLTMIPTAIPEPTSSVLLGLAGMSFLIRRKRK